MNRKSMDITDLIHISTAGEIRGVRRQAIYYQVAHGKLVTFEIDGSLFVLRSQVLTMKLRAPSNSAAQND